LADLTGSGQTEQVAQEVLEAMNPIMRVVFTELRQFGHPSHYVLLAMLARRTRTLTEMADYQGVSLPSMSSTVTTLEEYGWVTRVRDENDRRVVRIELTADGYTTFAAMQQTALTHIAAHLSQLSPSEQTAVANGLRLLRDALSLPGTPESEGKDRQ
jgi:DNA-binding MarR family transcriptional regulator